MGRAGRAAIAVVLTYVATGGAWAQRPVPEQATARVWALAGLAQVKLAVGPLDPEGARLTGLTSDALTTDLTAALAASGTVEPVHGAPAATPWLCLWVRLAPVEPPGTTAWCARLVLRERVSAIERGGTDFRGGGETWEASDVVGAAPDAEVAGAIGEALRKLVNDFAAAWHTANPEGAAGLPPGVANPAWFTVQEFFRGWSQADLRKMKSLMVPDLAEQLTQDIVGGGYKAISVEQLSTEHPFPDVWAFSALETYIRNDNAETQRTEYDLTLSLRNGKWLISDIEKATPD